MTDAPQHTILIAQADQAARSSNACTLRQAGYRVVEACDGGHALALARVEMPALMVLDMLLPDIDGREVCRRIKGDDETAHIMVLQASASQASTEDRLADLAMSADAYLDEPFEPKELITAVKPLLRLYEREQENRRLLAELRTSEAEFRAFFDLAAMGTVICDPSGRFLEVNDQFCRITGYSAGELAAMTLSELLDPDDYEQTVPLVRRWLAGEQPLCRIDTRYRRKDGRRVWVRVNGNLLHDAGGGVLRALGIVEDITERRRIQLNAEFLLKLGRNISRLTDAGEIGNAAVRALAEYLNVPEVSILEIDMANNTAQPAYFWSVDERAPEPAYAIGDFADTEIIRLLKDGEAVVLHDAAAQAENFMAAGAKAWAAAPHVSDGDWEAVLVVSSQEPRQWRTDEVRCLQNVVARVWPAVKRARVRTALRESEERLRLALESAGAGIWDLNVQTGAMIWSPENCRLYGVEPERYVPKYETWRNIVHPDDLGRIERERQEDTRAGRAYRVEYRIRKPSGEVRWLSSQGNAYRDSRGELVRMLGINIDVTERKRMEDALREADRKKDEFLAILAHELRNPLAPLRTGLEILKRAGGNLALAENVCDMMDRALTQSVRLVDDLLDISRISRGKLVLKKERVELAAVVHAAVETSRPFVDEKQHELTVTLPSAPVLLDGDPVRLSQVIANLLNNAAKYSDNGGRIQLLAKVENDEALVSVRDSGVGIATADLPRVFEMFAQLDTSLEKSRGGLGIGLSLAKQLIEMHGGCIEVKSDGLGHGSEFIARLPVVHLKPAAHEASHDDTKVNGSGKRVLVVDDNRLGADSLAIMLQLHGHKTARAYDGVQALALAESFHPEVILLDIGMPNLSGYEVARRIRAAPWGKTVVLVATTGWGQEEDRRRSQDAGFDHHMVKPVNPHDLARLVGEVSATG